MEKKYYNLKEIEKIFFSYRNPKHSVLTKKEYGVFCREIVKIPKTIIDTIDKEIYFVLMSAQPGKGTPACYVNLRLPDMKNRKGIVVFSPYIFGAVGKDKNGKDKKYSEVKDLKIILHEIAHHVLNHSNEDEEKENKGAWDQVEEWENAFVTWKRRR